MCWRNCLLVGGPKLEKITQRLVKLRSVLEAMWSQLWKTWFNQEETTKDQAIPPNCSWKRKATVREVATFFLTLQKLFSFYCLTPEIGLFDWWVKFFSPSRLKSNSASQLCSWRPPNSLDLGCLHFKHIQCRSLDPQLMSWWVISGMFDKIPHTFIISWTSTIKLTYDNKIRPLSHNPSGLQAT